MHLDDQPLEEPVKAPKEKHYVLMLNRYPLAIFKSGPSARQLAYQIKAHSDEVCTLTGLTPIRLKRLSETLLEKGTCNLLDMTLRLIVVKKYRGKGS